ncbi:integrator complex subunit 5 isoform X4 [Hydra vulgaris]|uniref:Integrator complex subunit 5 isoform X4 n=1 Tax=Hydra vulgaris TaxID=6087 RepID=A0ABM4BC19_HYDVU
MQSSQVLLDDVTLFLSKDSEEQGKASEDRTDCATALLQSLPCSRYAVLEKIGEVFFLESQHYIIEVERQHLEDAPPNFEPLMSKRSAQIKKIQQVLAVSVEANSKAWAPMIFQWAVQTTSQICGQYGTKRHFSTFTIGERFQLWLNCSATNVLLEITVGCLQKIILKNQDNCLKCLLNAALSNSPYFDWALAHIYSVFPEIIPYKFLCHVLEAFSNQSRKTDLLIETMLAVFNHVADKHHLHTAVLKLMMESIEDKRKAETHTSLCTIPFLLHITIKQPELFLPLVDSIMDTLTDDKLRVLDFQSLKRDALLQRGLLRRITDCMELVRLSSYKLFQMLLKYANRDDVKLNKEDPILSNNLQSASGVILESFELQLRNKIHVSLISSGDKVKVKIPFLSALSSFSKELCSQMISASGRKKRYLELFIFLCAKQEGIKQMVMVLSFLLTNSNMSTSNVSTLMKFANDFKLVHSDIIAQTLHALVNQINGFSSYIVNTLLQNLFLLLKEQKSFSEIHSLKLHLQQASSSLAQVLLYYPNDMDLCSTILNLLKPLLSPKLRMSDFAILSECIVACYFFTLEKFDKMKIINDFDSICHQIEMCNNLLITLVIHYSGVHQLIIRLLIEGFMKKREEVFCTVPEESLIRVELLQKNYTLVNNNRYSNNATAVSFQDGLKINKRKMEFSHTQNNRFAHHMKVITLSKLLAVPSAFSPIDLSRDIDKKERSFLKAWGENKFSRLFPSAYAYTANLLVEFVCPELVPVSPWPEEDFLKYTIERDLKIKRAFDNTPVLWDILELISSARPSLFHCSVVVQSLLGMSLKFWLTNRQDSSKSCEKELKNVIRIIVIIKQAGWLPTEFENISDIFPLIKPKEIFEILSAIWKYLQVCSFAPEKVIDRDQLGRPHLPVHPELFHPLRTAIKIVFLRNMAILGHSYRRFLGECSV